ncbi:MAG: universal stress protein [Alphaproteobacteria bacterium]
MIKTIVVATDGSDHAGKALDLASDLASKYGARLVVLHVLMSNARSDTLLALADRDRLPDELRNKLDNYEADFQSAMMSAGGMTGYVPAPPPPELLMAIAGQILDDAEAKAKKAGVTDVVRQAVGGDAADAVLASAKDEKADMIVLGSRGLSDFKGLLLGSVSHKVSNQAECTCVTVK